MPATLRDRAISLRRDVHALYLAARHPGTPWYAKALVAAVAAYALSPIDLIPDFIPVLGYLDDLILVPFGIALAVRLIPTDVMAECRARVAAAAGRPRSLVAAAIFILVWIALSAVFCWWAVRRLAD